MKKIRRMIAAGLVVVALIFGTIPLSADEMTPGTPESLPFEVDCKSAVLMDAETGSILYRFHETEALPPASVTKVMTLLLIMEAIDGGRMSLTDSIQVSEYAASMGGSQIFLKPGESMSVEDLLKSVIIASANDAAVALAEAVAGSVESFVSNMNKRAEELGLTSSHFENVTGLDDQVTNHVFSALDIAVCSRELLKHSTILNYSGIWMDTIRNGAFGLTNTNRLIRFYSGATGLKTGFTAKAMYCISATAKRGDLHLIAVVMGAPTRDVRNAIAKKLLDWGFANYELFRDEGGQVNPVRVIGGASDATTGVYSRFSALVGRGEASKVKKTVTIAEPVPAPIDAGSQLGNVVYTLGDQTIGEIPLTASESVPKIGFFGNLSRLLSFFLLRF